MSQILVYFFIGISLSMDAFSLAISLGTIIPTTKQIIKLSLIVGLFHFIMPILGNTLGIIIKEKLLKTNYLTSIIFILLGIEMLREEKENKIEIINNLTILLIAITVSIDSLTVGLAFGINKENKIISSIIFMILSSIFTYQGLIIGKKLGIKYQNQANKIGAILMFLISIKYLISI